MKNDKKILGVALIGCGAIARTHAAAIEMADELSLVGAFDNNEEFGRAFAESKKCKFYTSLEDVYKDSEVDLVTVCTPSGLHYTIAKQLLQGGKNVLVEKPLALKTEQCVELKKIAQEKGLTCVMIAQQRFFEAMRIVKRAIEEGRLGKIVMATLDMKYYRDQSYYAGSKWKGSIENDGGVIMNQGIHGVDLMCYFLGKPENVYAEVRTLDKKIEADDTVVATVTYPNGALGVITCTVCAYSGYPRRIEINGTKGSVAIEETEIVRWDIDGEEIPVVTDIQQAATFKDSRLDDCSGHLKQYKDVAAHLLRGEKLYYSVDDVIDTIFTIEQIYSYRK